MCSGGWIKDHKKELLAAAAIAGVGAATGGFGLLAAPAVAGEAAAGAVAGDAFLPGLLGSEGGAIAGDAFLPGLLGAQEAPSALSGLGSGLERFGKASQMARMAGLTDVPRETPPPMPQQGVQQLNTQSGIPSMAQTYPTNVVDEERKRRMMKMRGMYG